MRPINKGVAPKNYRDYGEARHDLANRIGYYCSYCEMKVFQSIEVEHILPQNQGGNIVDWDNFLLSCKYCNTIKSDKNTTLIDYLWPDRDNTDLVFDYSEIFIITPKVKLVPSLDIKAQKTIKLMGLDRVPGGDVEPTKADTRWRSRQEIWSLAKKSFTNWKKAPIEVMAFQIANTALSSGHYSIWCNIFETEQMVLDKIDAIYRTKGLFKEFDISGKRRVRTNGLI